MSNANMPRILVIDDESQVRAAIKIALQAHDFDVLAVESGRLGLRAFDESHFDLAIVDIFMLEMDGATLVKALRKRAPNLPIVVISGGEYGPTMLDIFSTAPGLSGIACLQKPFRPKELIRAMQAAKSPVGPSVPEDKHKHP